MAKVNFYRGTRSSIFLTPEEVYNYTVNDPDPWTNRYNYDDFADSFLIVDNAELYYRANNRFYPLSITSSHSDYYYPILLFNGDSSTTIYNNQVRQLNTGNQYYLFCCDSTSATMNYTTCYASQSGPLYTINGRVNMSDELITISVSIPDPTATTSAISYSASEPDSRYSFLICEKVHASNSYITSSNISSYVNSSLPPALKGINYSTKTINGSARWTAPSTSGVYTTYTGTITFDISSVLSSYTRGTILGVVVDTPAFDSTIGGSWSLFGRVPSSTTYTQTVSSSTFGLPATKTSTVVYRKLTDSSGIADTPNTYSTLGNVSVTIYYVS